MNDLGRVCPKYHRAVELIGRRWTGAIIVLLLDGKTRFHEISANVPQMSDRMLSERLKELEVEGVVERVVTPDTPVRVDYLLTQKGRALEQAVSAISAWAEEWVQPPEEVAAGAVGGRSESPDSRAVND